MFVPVVYYKLIVAKKNPSVKRDVTVV